MRPAPAAPIGEDDLHALVDGRLDPVRRAAVERHLAGHPADAARVAAYAAQRQALGAALAFKAQEPIPARLRLAHLRAGRRAAMLRRARMAAAAAVLLMLGGGLGWTVRGAIPSSAAPAAAGPAVPDREPAGPAAPRMAALARETDIAAWLLPRLREPLLPPDLTGFGFALEVAWVLPGSDGPGAMLLYVDPDGSALTIWRRPARDPLPRDLRCADEPGGLVTYSWSDGRLLHAVTAAMPRDRLRPIALFVERALEAPPPPALVARVLRRPCDTGLG
jgi:anti-sigma factor RsiW